MNSKEIGILGEQAVRKYLLDHDYEVLEMNYRIPYAEIDLIASKNNAIIFCEVKTNAFNSRVREFNPEIRVDFRKFNKIARLAEYYLTKKGIMDKEWQIDILAVSIDWAEKKAKVKHFQKVNFE